MKNKLPNFLIVGAAKCGTTSLHNYLNQHPDIFMPSFDKEGKNIKEPQFFVKDRVIDRIHFGVWEWDNYKNLFKEVETQKAIGEASVFYLYYFEEAICNIKKYLNDNVRIIIILRNPVERAYSAYKHVSRSLKETLSFENALTLENERLENDKTLTPMVRYKDMGLYYKMVNAYLESFDHVHIVLHDDFANNPNGELKKIYQFLSVDESINVDYSTHYNVGTTEWKNQKVKSLILNNSWLKDIMHRFVSKRMIATIKKILIFLAKRKVVKMKKSSRTKLLSFYQNDIHKLSDLIKRDLSLWLQ